jgi:hypothetical protein
MRRMTATTTRATNPRMPRAIHMALSLALCLLAPLPLLGQVYVAQSSAGSNTGTSCANARAVSSLVSGDWVAGNTIHLCGTFTGSAGQSRMVNIQGSGSSGNPITILFEPGANATAPYWGTGGFIGSSSARSFITIDGGGTGSVFTGTFVPNGDIKATANGASLANHVAGSNCVAFTASGSHDITIKNLECENMFVAVQNSANNETTSGAGGNSAFATILGPTSNITIQNNIAHDMFNQVYMYYTTSSNWTITGNKFYDMETNIFGDGNAGATLNGLTITNNDFSNMALWDAPADANHHEFIHPWAVQSGSSITNFTVAGNYFHGTLGATMTAETFIECTPGTCTVNYYNNLISMDDASSDIFTGAGGNGMTECKGGTCKYYNNTFISTVGHGSSANNAMHFEASAHVTSQNNICTGMNGCLSNGGGTQTLFDSMDCFNLSAACTGATNLQTGNPNLDSNLKPTAGSAAIGHAANLTSLSITGLDSDRAGNSRPSSGAWDIGAYNASGVATFTLSAGIAGTGSGTITCTPSAPGSYPSGTSISCSASASAGSTLTSVTGTGSASGCSGTGACAFTITANSTVLATFAADALTPGFSPVAGAYGAAQTVTISSGTSGATICYTVDGSTPTASAGTCTHGTTYSTPVSVSTSETVKAIASKSGFNDSTVGSAAYTINGAASTPTFSPVAGTYGPTQNVTISSSTSGATICYTSDGSSPTANGAGVCTHGNTYSGAVAVSSSLTLKAIASKSTFLDSSIGSAAYVINGAVADPSFSPVAGTYNSAQSVTLASTSGAAICYTVDGTTPTASAGSCTHGTTYSGAISVAASQTIKAIASKSLFVNSSVTSAAYLLQVANLSFSPGSGSYATTQSVTISTSTPSAVICYTTDGSTPTTDGAGTCTHGTTYSGAVSVASSLTINAVGTESGFTDSPVSNASYAINGTLATPTFSPAAGSYGSSQTVTISVASGGSVTIVNTMQESGNTADSIGSSVHRNTYTNCATGYSGGQLQPAGQPVGTLYCTSADKTAAVAAGGPNNGVVSSTISGTGTSALDNGNGAGGSDSPTSVTATYAGSTGTGCGAHGDAASGYVSGLTFADPGASAQMVMGITTGSPGNSSILTVSKYNSNGDTGRYVARRDCANFNLTAVTGEHYEFDLNYNTSGGTYMGFGNDYDIPNKKFRACPQGCSGWTNEELCPVLGGACVTTYNPPTTGYPLIETYYHWDAGCTYSSATACAHYDAIGLQQWSGGSPVGAMVYYTVQNASTHGTIDFIPINKTSWTHPQYGIQHQWDINQSSQTLTATIPFSTAVAYIPTATAATICYTTDGSTPTGDGAGNCTHGTTYTGPITVSTSETVKAIATQAGFTDSSVGSAAYVINGAAATPTFSPVAGTYTSTQSVTISSSTSGATLCYTTDGSTPTADGAGTCTHGTTYSTAVSVSISLTLKAIASKSGFTDSGTGSAAYIISAAGPNAKASGHIKFSGKVGIQ